MGGSEEKEGKRLRKGKGGEENVEFYHLLLRNLTTEPNISKAVFTPAML